MVERGYIEELIQRRIDGELSPQEEAKLDEYLANNDEAREYYKAMTSIPDIISCLPVQSPPEDLKPAIMMAVCGDKRRIGSRSTWIKRLQEFVQVRHNIRFAYGLAAGMVLGIIIHTSFSSLLSQQTGSDYSEYGGTLAPTESAEANRMINTIPFDMTDSRGVCHIYRSTTGVLVEIDIHAATTTDVRIEYDSPSFTLREYRQQIGGVNTVESSPGVIMITHQGENSYLISLSAISDATGQITLTIQAGDRHWRHLIYPPEGGE